MKTFNDAIDFANQNPFCFAATIDGDKPRVRGLRMWRADKTGFLFASPKNKNIIHQLNINPNIEVCFYKWGNIISENAMLRISGRVNFITDNHMIEISTDALNNQKLVLFKIIVGEASVWKGSDGWRSGSKTFLFDISDSINVSDWPEGAKRILSFKENVYDYYLDTKNIVYLSSRKKHTIIHTENRDYEVTGLLKIIKDRLPAQHFLRIQKQYIVNLIYIDRIEYLEGGRYLAYLNDNDDTILPVGRNYVETLKTKIANYVSFVP